MRVDIKEILNNPTNRKKMCVGAIKAIQNREGIDTTIEQAEIAYDNVQKEKTMNDVNKVKSLRNALDDIVKLCDDDKIRPKMKLTLVETIAELALGLTNDENSVYEK